MTRSQDSVARKLAEKAIDEWIGNRGGVDLIYTQEAALLDCLEPVIAALLAEVATLREALESILDSNNPHRIRSTIRAALAQKAQGDA